MNSEDIESIAGTMIFHVSAATVLARTLATSLGPSGLILISSMIEESVRESPSKHEQAFWLTLKDFFDPDVNADLSEAPIEFGATQPKRKDH